jgi:uncharacterized membrane protein
MALISINELIDQSWEHYRREFPELMSVSGWLLLVAIANIAALALYPSASHIVADGALGTTESAGVALYAVTNWALAPALGLWTFLSLARLVAGQLSSLRPSPGEAMAEGARLFFPAVAVSVLLFLLIAAVVAIGFGPGALLSVAAAATGNAALAILSSASLVVGVIVALVLGFRWSVRYYFAPFALVVDGIRPRASLPASRELTEGRAWGVLWRLVFPKLVFALFAILGVSVIAFVFSLVTNALAGLNLDAQLRLSTISTTVLSTIAAVLVNPLIVTADVLLYRSLKR